ncbi:MAG: hypothetical protein ABEJ27_07155 [Halodesulfurarchaeum sp.]
MRAQANLLALAMALVVLTAAVGIALFAATGTIDRATGEPADRAVAAGITSKLVGPEGVLRESAGMVDATRLEALDDRTLRALLPADSQAHITVSVDGVVVATTGTASDGVTIRRLIRVVEYRTVTRPVGGALTNESDTTLRVPPTPWLELSVNGSRGTVREVRSDGRTVLLAPEGLNGTVRLGVPPSRETTLWIRGSNGTAGTAQVTYLVATVRLTTLVVEADA